MKTTTRKAFKHLSQYERDRIEKLRFHLTSCAEIARILGRDKGTISRELKKYTNKHHRYRATAAHKTARVHRTVSEVVGMKIEANPPLKRYIIKKLKKLRSPDEIAGRLKKEGVVPRVGTNAIYKWLYSDNGKPYCIYLCTKRTRRRSPSRLSRRPLIPNKISITERPDDDTQTHGESDLFVSPTRLHSRPVGHLVVLSDTKLLVGQLLPNKSRTRVDSIHRIENILPVTTRTLDNGIENVYHEEWATPVYFCTPGVHGKSHTSRIVLISRDGGSFQKVLTLPRYLKTPSNRCSTYSITSIESAYERSLHCGIITKIPRLSIHPAVAFR